MKETNRRHSECLIKNASDRAKLDIAGFIFINKNSLK